MVHARARLLNLRKQHGWGDISDAEYRTQVEETCRMLAEVPDHGKLVLFDLNRTDSGTRDRRIIATRWRGTPRNLLDGAPDRSAVDAWPSSR
jgi:hypothetical protein